MVLVLLESMSEWLITSMNSLLVCESDFSRHFSITFDEYFWLLRVQILFLIESKIGLLTLMSQVYAKISQISSYIDNLGYSIVAKWILDQVDNVIMDLV